MARLVKTGKLTATGTTRSRRYALALLVDRRFTIPISPSTQEDQVWRERVAPLLEGIPANVLDICFYGFTEMLNNVIDHSASPSVCIVIQRSPVGITLMVLDKGVGIFRKIARELHLDDERHAVLELCKGKLTTDAKRHSGEGIFFTSRMFDSFVLQSGELALVTSEGEDWAFTPEAPGIGMRNVDGTGVVMRIDPRSQRRQLEVFSRFAIEGEDYGFIRTHVPVALAKHGKENLLSRSQAKRLLARFDRFKEVLLDFAGVQMIGQAFADEVFRVFSSAHPETHLSWTNTTPEVERMIRRALAASEG